MNRHCAVLPLSLLAAVVALGQVSSQFSSGPDGTFHGSSTFQVPRFAPHPVVGAPYYGEEVSEHVQTLADGVHISQTTMGQKTWRDSQGRTRTERPIAMGATHLQSDVPTLIQITDPVAGYMYTLDTEKKVAHRVALPSLSASGGTDFCACAVPAGVRASATNRPAVKQKSEAQLPQVTNVALGTKSVSGVLAEGTRQTMAYPAGSQDNDAPFSVISENWWSTDLKLMLLSTRDDPRSGVHTQKIDNLSTQEPDPTLFMLPTGYTVVDETGSFTITWGAQER